VCNPTAVSNVGETVTAFQETGTLSEFWTTLAWKHGSILDRALPRSILAQLRRRTFAPKVFPYIRTYGRFEVGRLISQKLGGPSSLLHSATGYLGLTRIHRTLDQRVARRIRTGPPLSAVYSYDHCSLESFGAAKSRGIHCIYDLPIGYWRAFREICHQEPLRWPEWAELDPFAGYPESVLEEKDKEIALADLIVVASRFTKQTLSLYPHRLAPIEVIPYGAPPVPRHNSTRYGSRSGPLKVLFVGSLGLRKGIPYLLEAIRAMGPHVELTLIGQAPNAPCRPLTSALKKHRWIRSLPNSAVLDQMGLHDVLVFPSLFEGFGLVILEALSRGLPVITTPNTGGPDVLVDGTDGFIVPIRSSQGIAEKLEHLIRHPEIRKDMSASAERTAERLTWQKFRASLATTVLSSLNSQTKSANAQ
jgi:alpha-maltose-1-phosphate synthase